MTSGGSAGKPPWCVSTWRIVHAAFPPCANAGHTSATRVSRPIAPRSISRWIATAVTGFVADETLASATQGQLRFQTTANGSSASGRYAVIGSGLSALFDNYVFVQAPGNAESLTITAALPVIDQFLPKTAPVPNFPDNAVPALGPTPQTFSGSNLNYVSLSSATLPSGTSPFGTTTTANAGSGGSSAGGGPIGSAEAGNGRNRTARPGVAATAVPSANGPLDIFVIDGGLNLGTGTGTLTPTFWNAIVPSPGYSCLAFRKSFATPWKCRVTQRRQEGGGGSRASPFSRRSRIPSTSARTSAIGTLRGRPRVVGMMQYAQASSQPVWTRSV